MTDDLKTEIAKHIESEERTKSNCAPIPPFEKFKQHIEEDVDLALSYLKGNLEDIVRKMQRLNEFQNENIGDLHSTAASLIAFFCKKWNIKQKKRHVH